MRSIAKDADVREGDEEDGDADNDVAEQLNLFL